MIMKTPHINVYRVHLVLIRGKLISLTLISENQSIISISSLEKSMTKEIIKIKDNEVEKKTIYII